MGVSRQMATDDIRVNLELRGERAMSRGLKNVGDAADDAGTDLRDMGDDAGFLSKQVIQTSDNLKKLVTQLDKTGDTSLLKDIRKGRRELRQFQNLAKELVPDDVAVGVGKQIMSGIASAASAAGPAKIAIAGIGVAAAPLIGASVAGAVLGGVGLGGIAGGIALAAQDPAVKTAAQELAGSVSAAFSSNGETFVQPVVDSLDLLATTGVNAATRLKPGMDALAGTVVPLARGIDGFTDGLVDGLIPAAKAAVPVVRFLANELPELGQTFGDFFAKVSADPDGAILALHTLLDITEQAVDGAGNLVAGLSAVYEGSVRGAAAATGALEDILGWVPWVGNIYSSTNDDLEEMLADLDKAKITTDDLTTSTERVTYVTYGLGVAANDAADAITAQRDAMSKLIDLELAAISGTVAFERAIDNLAEARKENGKAVGTETEAERRNTEELLRGIEVVKQNAEREYQLALAHGATAQEAERAAAAYRDKFGAELKAQIVRLFGNTTAVQALLAELEKLNGKRITYTIVQQGGRTVGFKETGGIQLKDDVGVYRRAGGGSTVMGRTYRVGENGPELLHMGANGYVTNAAATKAMTASASGGSQMATGGGMAYLQPAPNMPADMTALARLLIPYFQVVIAGLGGSVEDAMGTPVR